MNSSEIREQFLEFFKSKGHAKRPSSSLVPDDPSVLLTTAGMQQFKPYYTGEADAMKDFGALSTASIQKSFRTSDIDEVGDESHLTFFEMLGNFSFGGYFKEEAIKYAREFITQVMKLEISYVTVFKGSDAVPKDKESKKIWESLGVKDIREEGMDDVFWGPTGKSGPCGPTTEIYCRNGAGKDIEIWNIVFNEFFCSGSREELLAGRAELKPLKTKGIDTGMGLERLAMVSQKTNTIFETDLFAPILNNLKGVGDGWSGRIVADHIRGIIFLTADGVRPDNKNQGYILRRLIRRVIPHLKERQGVVRFNNGDKIPRLANLKTLSEYVISQYGSYKEYKYLLNEKSEIIDIVLDEEKKFLKIYEKGSKLLNNLINEAVDNKTYKINGKDVFILVTTHGFALEWIKDATKLKGVELDAGEFEQEFKKHQEISRGGVEKKFGGHGLILDTGELKAGNEEELKKVTRLHTATHLLNAALHRLFGNEISQRGSDITTQRTRYDFTFSRKITPEELQKLEDMVNEAVKKDYPVTIKEMPLEEAKKSGALFFYKGRYPDVVRVYTVGKENNIFSRELCGGPHVKHTGEIGKFRILKEESSSAGIRRIRAVVDD